MRILDENDIEITNPDLEKGHLEDDVYVIHHEAVAPVEGVSHIEIIAEYPNGGKDIKEVWDIEPVEGVPAYDEKEDILRYILYTSTEIKQKTDDEKIAKGCFTSIKHLPQNTWGTVFTSKMYGGAYLLSTNADEWRVMNATAIGNMIYLPNEAIVSIKAKSAESADIKIIINRA